ncbi:MAG: glycosyltransferase family 4 protein [Parcubacteria group bacterium]|nr:glycosyltransferase family 4 protein [Parcubacteria group bacterium]
MRVLMFGWEFPPFNSGGLGVACLGLTKALAQEGVEVLFVLPRKLPVSSSSMRFLFADQEAKVTVKNLDLLLTPYITSHGYEEARRRHGSSLYGTGLFAEVHRYARLAEEIARREDFDVIHAHDWLSFGAGLAAKEVSGKPLVVHVHATEFDRTGGNTINQYVYEKEREGLHAADRVVTVSTFTKQMVVDHYGVNPTKISVIHNAVEHDERRCAPSGFLALKNEGTKIVLFVGRLTLQKGPDYFLRAAKRVLTYDRSILFLMAGAGDMERQIMEEAAYLGIADRVLFLGFLRDEELGEVYRSADLFVMPSVSEPFGITPLEALSYGTPVLISKQAGVGEVLPHALKVDFWDIEEMANQILAALSYPVLREVLIDEGKRDAARCSWQDSARSVITLYQHLLGPSY